MDEIDLLLSRSDPARVLLPDTNRAVAGVIRKALRGRRHKILPVTVLALATLAAGGGVAYAAPGGLRSIFDPQVTTVELRVVSTGAAPDCTTSVETQIVSGDFELAVLEERRTTMRIWRDYVKQHTWTVRVDPNATRADTLLELSKGVAKIVAAFDREHPDSPIEAAADITSHTDCSNDR